MEEGVVPKNMDPGCTPAPLLEIVILHLTIPLVPISFLLFDGAEDIVDGENDTTGVKRPC